jgi:hypothetical protein
MEESKSTFHETKEITTRLREPIKFKLVPYKTQKEAGHIIQVEFNLSWDQIDTINTENGPIQQGILNCISTIEGPLRSKYVGSNIVPLS